MIIRIVSGSTLRVVELEDVSQVVVMADSGEPLACAHETPGGSIVATNVGDADFEKTLASLGVKPAKVVTL